MDEVFKEKYRSKNLQVNTESFNKNCTNLKLSEIDITENIESDYMIYNYGGLFNILNSKIIIGWLCLQS